MHDQPASDSVSPATIDDFFLQKNSQSPLNCHELSCAIGHSLIDQARNWGPFRLERYLWCSASSLLIHSLFVDIGFWLFGSFEHEKP
jgi:hypothetical protein